MPLKSGDVANESVAISGGTATGSATIEVMLNGSPLYLWLTVP
jgi:hypothetical protein